MRQRVFVRMIAAQVPAGLRAMRGRMMLESVHEFLGVDEVPCPACAGSGWLSRRRLERCPVCCGFRQVPVGLADWYRAQAAVYHEGHEEPEGRHEKNANHNDTTGTTDGQGLAYLMDESLPPAEPGTLPAVFSAAGPSS